MSEPPTVVVLGMHRGGTSALAGALAAMGLCAGREPSLLAADEANPRGYFERRDVVECNEALLVARLRRHFGDLIDDRVFDVPAVMDGYGWLLGTWLPTDLADDARDERRRRCLQALREEAGDAGGLLLKDPRLCLTLPAWSVPGQRWLAVLALRRPSATARSLQRRDHMEAATAGELWHAYLQAAVHHSRDLPRVAVDYDRLLDSPAETLAGLADFLRGHGVGLADDATARAVASLDPALRRSADSAPDEGSRLYRRLAAAAPEVTALAAPAAPADLAGLQRAQRLPMVHRLLRLHARVEELDRSRVQLERLLAHPVTGPLVRLLRRVKRDAGFGAP